MSAAWFAWVMTLPLTAGVAPDLASRSPTPQVVVTDSAAALTEPRGAVPGGPVGIDDHFVAVAGQTLSVAAPGFLANDIDLNGQALTGSGMPDNVDNGTLTAFADGRFDYTPDPGFVGTDSFSYRVRDSSFNFFGPVTVTIDVIDTDRPPAATADSYAAVVDTPLTIAAPGILANDVDPDGGSLTATSIEDATDSGMLIAFSDGRFTYVPDPAFTGTDSFVYRVRDPANKTSEAVVSIEVFPGGSAPVGTDDHFIALADQVLSVAAPGVLVNDVDRNGEPLIVTSILEDADFGTLIAFGDGRFTYVPDPAFTGTDSFVYRVRDASMIIAAPVTVTIDVIEGDRRPLGTGDTYAVAVNVLRQVAAPGVLANDLDPDGTALAVSAILDPPDFGTLALFPNGSFNYLPALDFGGTDAFVYRSRDASGKLSDPVTVTMQIVHPSPLVFSDGFE